MRSLTVVRYVEIIPVDLFWPIDKSANLACELSISVGGSAEVLPLNPGKLNFLDSSLQRFLIDFKAFCEPFQVGHDAQLEPVCILGL